MNSKYGLKMVDSMTVVELERSFKMVCRSVLEAERILKTAGESNREHVGGLLEVFEAEKARYGNALMARGVDVEKIEKGVVI